MDLFGWQIPSNQVFKMPRTTDIIGTFTRLYTPISLANVVHIRFNILSVKYEPLRKAKFFMEISISNEERKIQSWFAYVYMQVA